MKAEAERRRPFVAAFALCALICAGLVVPLLLSGTGGDPGAGAVRAASRDSITLTWPVPLLASPSVVLERGTLTLADAAGQSSGARLLALLTGDGADLTLDNARFVIGRAPAGASEPFAPAGPPDAAAMEPVVAALTAFNFQKLYLNEVSAVIRTEGRPDEILESITGEVFKSRGGAIDAKLKFWLRGEKLSADISMSARGSNADAPVPMRLALHGKHIDLRLDGRLAPGERMQVSAQNAELKVPNLREAARWLDSDWPAGQGLGAFTAKGPVVIDEKSVAFENARIVLDGNTGTGAVSLTLGRERPSLEGTLAFDNLDVAPYITTQKTDLLTLAGTWLANLRMPGAAQPSLVRELDADLRVSARSVAVGSDRFGRCAASVSIKDGKLLGELAEMELEQGGSGEGQISLDTNATDPRYTLRASLQDVDMKSMAAHLGGPALEGSGDFSVDLSAEGGTGEQLLSSLTGSVTLDMREGARLGLSLDSLAAAGGAPHPVAWDTVTAGSTAVDTLVARITATSGVFTAKEVEAANPDRTIKALGTVSAEDRSLDMTVSVVPASPKAGDAASSPAYRIQGPWATPLVSKVPPPGKAALPLGPTVPSVPGPAAPSSGTDQNRG
jgi:AsmA protein